MLMLRGKSYGGRKLMRSKTMVTLIFVAGLSVFAGASAAQDQMPNMTMPQQSTASGQQQSAKSAASGQQAAGKMDGDMSMPDMMRMMGPMMVQAQGRGMRGHEADGPLQRFSKLMDALDDPRARQMLGLSDQQADSLRKLVIDTETFTITTGANIAVDTIELRELLRADKPDKAAVKTKGDEISKDTSELINHYLDAILSAKAMLTPEQQKTIREYLANGAPEMPPSPPPRPARP
jgi:Heavy-metal resistance